MLDYDLVEDIRACPDILDKIRTRQDYAQNLYAAMCNMRWCKRELWPLLTEDYWSCSWRAAGGIVSDLQRKGGDYMDWYCSGIEDCSGDTPDERFATGGYVAEGIVTDEIELDFNRLGWIPRPWTKDNK